MLDGCGVGADVEVAMDTGGVQVGSEFVQTRFHSLREIYRLSKYLGYQYNDGGTKCATHPEGIVTFQPRLKLLQCTGLASLVSVLAPQEAQSLRVKRQMLFSPLGPTSSI